MKRGFAERYADLGNEHRDNDEEERAAKSYSEAIGYIDLLIIKQESDYCCLINCCCDLAGIYFRKGNLEKAKELLTKALEFLQKIDDNHPEKSVFSDKIDNYLLAIKQREALINESKEWGFEYQDIAGDGNCFFTAIVEQLKLLNISKYLNLSHQDLRRMTVDHLRDHSDLYHNFIFEDFNKYLATMRKDGTSG